MLARIATSRGIQLGFQVMLTMVSIDGVLNEELSRSLSLAKEILQVELACEMVEVGEIDGSGPLLARSASQEFSANASSRDLTLISG